MNGEAGLDEVAIAAAHLLSFRAQKAPDPQWPEEVRLQLASVAVEAAQRELAIGQTPLGGSAHTSRVEFSVFPEAP